MRPTKSTCDKDALIGWLDDSLPISSRARVQDHLRTCEACRQQLQSLESTLELARTLVPAPDMGPFEGGAFVHKVRGRISAQGRTSWLRSFWPSASGGFVSGAVVGALSLFFILGGVPEPVADSAGGSELPSAVESGSHSVREAAALTAYAGASLADAIDEEAAEEEEWAGVIDEYLIDTASEAELFNEMQSLIGEEDLYALLEEF